MSLQGYKGKKGNKGFAKVKQVYYICITFNI